MTNWRVSRLPNALFVLYIHVTFQGAKLSAEVIAVDHQSNSIGQKTSLFLHDFVFGKKIRRCKNIVKHTANTIVSWLVLKRDTTYCCANDFILTIAAANISLKLGWQENNKALAITQIRFDNASGGNKPGARFLMRL